MELRSRHETCAGWSGRGGDSETVPAPPELEAGKGCQRERRDPAAMIEGSSRLQEIHGCRGPAWRLVLVAPGGSRNQRKQ